MPEEHSVKSLKDEIASWPPEEQPGEEEARRLLNERQNTRVMETLRRARLHDIQKFVQRRRAS